MCIRDRLSPSYLNRQPYGFLVQDHSIYLVQQEDAYTCLLYTSRCV